jgi:hypothetical protein
MNSKQPLPIQKNTKTNSHTNSKESIRQTMPYSRIDAKSKSFIRSSKKSRNERPPSTAWASKASKKIDKGKYSGRCWVYSISNLDFFKPDERDDVRGVTVGQSRKRAFSEVEQDTHDKGEADRQAAGNEEGVR